ncbi:type II CAAX endopeptidase family protein [Bacillus cereus group sp. Bc002]|uniref:CPBP family intramembrane glutamic endopeptidase n=1 Tax=Bacillus cereus group sp. Bc002 TaxID=3018130 RepID=UPI0022DFD1AB|nr:type II CAAX endopeptidase family protein [Bacillus cereus group sp. Bc002]MDA2780712.1 type II CAAX endopeptidase family protein [Bacillus cereus group sp. Bc002]
MTSKKKITWLQVFFILITSSIIVITTTLVRNLGNENIITWFNFEISLYSIIVTFLFLYSASYHYLKGEWNLFALLKWKNYILFFTAIILQFIISAWLLNIPLLSTWKLLTSPTAYYFEATWAQKTLFIIGMALLTAIAEEAIFRGIIFNKLLEKFNLFISMCLSAALFSILHLPITFTDAFIAFLLGILATSLYRFTRSLSIPIIFHSIWNLFIIFYSNYL